MLRRIVLFASCLLLVACGEDVAKPGSGGAIKILYLGNSHTGYNNLTALIAAMAESAGVGPVTYTDASKGNWGLQDHYAVHRHLVTEGDWDIVILQQGPSATEGRPSLLQYSRLFAQDAKAVGAKVGLYMVWPWQSRLFDFPGVFSSYSAAADTADGLFFPCGRAWQIAWEADPDLPLYAPDKSHASALGTYIAGLVIFEQLMGVSPIGMPSDFQFGLVKYDFDQATVDIAQEAAAEANRLYARRVPGWWDPQ